MPAAGQPKAQLDGAKFQQITIAQKAAFHLFTIHQYRGLRLGSELEAAFTAETNLTVPVPHARILKASVCFCGAANDKRKTADKNVGARLPAGKDLKLDHRLRGTWMASPGQTGRSNL